MKKLFVLILSLLSILVFSCLAASAKGESAQKADPVTLGQNFEITYNEKNNAYYLSFTAKESAWYEISLDSPNPKGTYTSTYDSTGKEIGFDYWEGYTSKCVSAVELTANQSYTIKITCKTEDKVIVSGKITKHSHNYNVLNIKKAGQNSDGYIEKECTICEHFEVFPIAKVSFTFSATSFVYNGKTQTPVVTVKDTTGKTFTNGTDYSVTYPAKSIDAGSSYSLIVEMKNDYYDTFAICDYEITPKNISKVTATLSAEKVVYGKKPTVKVSGLTQNKDYTCEISYDDVGKQTATIIGIGNYTGKKTLTYTVVPATVSGFKVAATAVTALKLSWKKDSSGETGYYQIYDVTTKKVIATLTSDKLSYTVKNLKAGTAYSFKVRAVSKVDGEKFYGSWVTVTGITKTAATAFKSLKSEKAKSFIAKWTAKSGVTGYQIQYSTAADFSNAKIVKVTGSSSAAKTVTGLQSGKKYYVRIRTYKTLKVSGETKVAYSAWSAASSVKVK